VFPTHQSLSTTSSDRRLQYESSTGLRVLADGVQAARGTGRRGVAPRLLIEDLSTGAAPLPNLISARWLPVMATIVSAGFSFSNEVHHCAAMGFSLG
jgi:hypothetical protein